MARHFPLSQSPEVRRIPCGFRLQRSALFCGSVVNPRRRDSHSGFSHPVTARSNGSVLTRRLNTGLAFVGRASTTTRFTLCLASILDRHPTTSQWWRGASPILLFHGNALLESSPDLVERRWKLKNLQTKIRTKKFCPPE
ncbi:hypothetical protein VNO77_19981 [Canavalia gladiata]|uniref:Uncharacterized protein n=1 Tax=Canavalia gladiata TaxID=3824 RepID=A0AAN9QLZ3_CANGL